jgi:hypothetical protein
MTMQVESPYLSVWEAANTLVDTCPSISDGEGTASAAQRWEDAVKLIETAARRGALIALGRRKTERDPKPIGAEYWVGASIDPDTGWLRPRCEGDPDQEQHTWAELRFAAEEVRAVAGTSASTDTSNTSTEPASGSEPAMPSPVIAEPASASASAPQESRPSLIDRAVGSIRSMASAEGSGPNTQQDPLRRVYVMAPYDPELDRRLKARIEAVLQEARQRWPNGERPSWRMMARALTDAGSDGKLYDLGMEAIRKILHGTYPAQRRLGISGFSAMHAAA